MKSLKPIYTIVARELALGIDLRDICEARNLNYESIQRVTRGALFQEEVRRFQGEIEEQMIDEAVQDPVLKKLRALSYRATGVLADEMENFDPESGASATSRISAADKVLNKAGYTSKPNDDNVANVIIMLSETKLNAVKKATEITEHLIKNVPDCVDGHLMVAH